jgi:hypothetical protein
MPKFIMLLLQDKAIPIKWLIEAIQFHECVTDRELLRLYLLRSPPTRAFAGEETRDNARNLKNLREHAHKLHFYYLNEAK